MREAGEPRTVEEAVLFEIARGLKFRWGKKHEQRGIGDLFKYSESERRKKIGMLSKDGYSVETFVEAIMDGYFDGSDIAYLAQKMDYSDLTTIVEDALTSVQSRTDALELIERRRADEAKAEEEYAHGMADAYAVSQGFTDYDELQAYEEWLKTYELTEAEYNEKNRIFAE